MLALIGTSIVLPEILIRSVVSISSSLITSISFLKTLTKDDLDLQKMIEIEDIETDILVIKNFIIEKSTENNFHTVQLCIRNLAESLFELEKQISSINEKIESHTKLYFRQFRSYNIDIERKQIPFLIKQLKHRFELLLKISKSLI